MHVPSFIEHKRDGAEHAPADIERFIRDYTAGLIPDYQASAWAMAVYFRGMTARETSALTRAMMHSGRVLEYPSGSPAKVDKHSTGGIGDKVSLVLAPLLACDDLWVPMISGRGLGITGGTLDKLESIPGFRVALTQDEMLVQLDRIGVCMIGQTADFCPADRQLYALRDVTATVPSEPLIVASIMSKKLAESLDRLVLDVKFGSGAFMKARAEAESLAAALSSVGREMGVRTSFRLTEMNEPLGRTAGNALEVAEAIDTLQGRGPADLVELTLSLASMVANAPREQLDLWLRDGSAWRKFVQMVEAQNGDSGVLESIADVHRAPIRHELTANGSGILRRIDAGAVGRACVALGAGRARATDQIDHAVGCSDIAKIGSSIEAGELLMRVHARDETSLPRALAFLADAIAIE